MKKFIIFITLIGCANIFAQKTSLTYECRCIDTGYECDGLDFMSLTLNGNTLGITLMDNDHDVTEKINATPDESYEERINEKFSRFNTDEDNDIHNVYQYLLIENTISKGQKSGEIKMPEFNEKGKLGHTWIFDCTLNKIKN